VKKVQNDWSKSSWIFTIFLFMFDEYFTLKGIKTYSSPLLSEILYSLVPKLYLKTRMIDFFRLLSLLAYLIRLA